MAGDLDKGKENEEILSSLRNWKILSPEQNMTQIRSFVFYIPQSACSCPGCHINLSYKDYKLAFTKDPKK